ncbi:MAG: hypothetical protein JSU87_02525, partial [Gemmatimonadota bacterium]
ILMTFIKGCEEKLAAAKALLKARPQVEKLVALEAKIDEAHQNRTSLHRIMAKVKTTETQLENAKQVRDELEAEFHAIMPDICPLCGKEVDNG